MPPSAVEILQAKRAKDEPVIDPAQILADTIGEVDEKLTEKKPVKVESPLEDEIEDSPEDDEEDSEEPTEDELDEQSLLEAKQLYKALRNPEQARGLVSDLANRLGMPLAQLTTKTEVKEAKKDITARLKEALGEELGFLADKIGPIFDQALVEERSNVETVSRTIEVQQLTRESESVLGKLAKETNGLSRKYEAKMVQLMDKFPSSPDTGTEEYIRGIAAIAMGSKLQQVASNKITNKIIRNSKDAPGRLATKGSGSQDPPESVKMPDKKLGARGAVMFALGHLQNQQMPTARNRKQVENGYYVWKFWGTFPGNN